MLTLPSVWHAAAQIVVSGNEAKIDLTSGTAAVVREPPPDTVSIIDFSSSPPRARHLTNISNSVIGPPSNVAITPDGRVALIADSIRVDASAASGYVPASTIHIIDLEADPPRVIGDVTAGRQPSGISIRADGRRALVANRAEGTVSLLAIEGTGVSLLQSAQVCTPAESISDVTFHPDGQSALASIQKGGYLAVLRLNGDHVETTGRKISAYGQPYRVIITPDGAVGLTAGQGFGNGPDTDALTIVDLRDHDPRTVDFVPLGSVPESFAINPKGDLVAAVVMNGSNLAAADVHHSDHGAVVLFARQGIALRRVQQIPVGRIPEGIVFTSDGRHLVVQCHPDRQLWVLDVRGGHLKDSGMRIPVPGMPSSLAAAPRP